MRGTQMEMYGYNFPSWYFMIMIDYKFVGLIFHGWFYTCIIIQCQQQWVSNGSVGLRILKIWRVIMIWSEVLFKLKVSFYQLVSRKKVFSESSHHIETHLNLVLEVLEVQSSVAFVFCIDEEFVEFWWSDLMFDISHATSFCIMSTF